MTKKETGPATSQGIAFGREAPESSLLQLAAQHFEEHGIVILRGILPEDAVLSQRRFMEESLQTLLERARAEVEGLGYALGSFDDLKNVPEKIEQDRAVERLTNETRLMLTGHFPLDVRLSPSLWQILKGESLQRALRTILRTKSLFMHMPPAARFVLPRGAYAAVPAHQDISYGSHMSTFITMWVPHVEIDDLCGGIAYFEGSGKDETVQEVDFGTGFWMPGVDARAYERVKVHASIGDVVILNRYLIHESLPNVSDTIRLSIDYRFFGADASTSKHCLDLRSWTVLQPK